MKVGLPVNDGGGETRDEYKKDTYEYPCAIPWYNSTVKVVADDKSYLGMQIIGDAPQISVLTKYAGKSDNLIESVEQHFTLETWLVVWDKMVSNPIHFIGKSEWEHHMSCKFKPFQMMDTASLMSAEITNLQTNYTENPKDIIPAKALVGPAANAQAKNGAEYKGNKKILEHQVLVE
jgi:hypothetical protein